MAKPGRQVVINAVRAALKTRNFEWIFRQFPNRHQLIINHQISLVLDVGANTGQYAKKLRTLGYAGRIISFEPLTREFQKLSKLSASDPKWDCKQLALGSVDESQEINIAGNSYSSSILPMLDRHVLGAPDSSYIGKETVTVSRLDSIQSSLLREHDRIFLKLDVQGYEMEVLKGSSDTLKQVEIIEMELSLTPLYEHSVLYEAMIEFMDGLGFDLLYIEGDFLDYTTGEVLQVNGIFMRR